MRRGEGWGGGGEIREGGGGGSITDNQSHSMFRSFHFIVVTIRLLVWLGTNRSFVVAIMEFQLWLVCSTIKHRILDNFNCTITIRFYSG